MYVVSAEMRSNKTNRAAPGVAYWDGNKWVRAIDDAAMYYSRAIADYIAVKLSREWNTIINVGAVREPSRALFGKRFTGGDVDNSAPSRRRNPVPLSTRASLKASRERFKDFRGDEPATVRAAKVKVPKSAMVVGELDGVLYTTRRDGKVEKYIHKFRKRSRPLLAASDDGKSLHIVGGRYAFTERGIVDE